MMYFFILFWTVMVFASIAWYGFLLFYVGAKGGREIARLTKDLSQREDPERDA
ncbi:MAG: hypothetical protein HY735_08345 [Verrucomicrobia bacterium]|nr:hypothetical protein [Verrucomicrobiota bacterium]